jgi:hypothetical protein
MEMAGGGSTVPPEVPTDAGLDESLTVAQKYMVDDGDMNPKVVEDPYTPDTGLPPADVTVTTVASCEQERGELPEYRVTLKGWLPPVQVTVASIGIVWPMSMPGPGGMVVRVMPVTTSGGATTSLLVGPVTLLSAASVTVAQ